MKHVSWKWVTLVSIMLVMLIVSGTINSASKNIGSQDNYKFYEAQADSYSRNQLSNISYSDTVTNSKGYNTVVRESFKPILQNDKFILYFNEENAEIALQDKTFNNIWYSNPSDKLESETLLAGTVKDALRAQFSVEYYDYSNNLCSMDSYNHSVVYGNTTHKLNTDTLSVTYLVGKNTVTLSDIPQQISKNRFEDFVSRLSDEDAKSLKSFYKLMSIKGKSDEVKETYKEQYPNIVNNDIYIVNTASSFYLSKVKSLFEKAGYTSEDLHIDNTENMITEEQDRSVNFTVVLDYRLDENGLNVTIDKKKIKCDKEIIISKITLLKTFGCGSIDDGGYLMVPDGCGSLIYFNNGKTNGSFSMRVYGDDTGISSSTHYRYDEKASLPVFGIKNNKSALVGIITEGSSYATINASTSGNENSFNCAYVSFIATSIDKITLGKSSEIISGETKPYDGNLTISYRPIIDETEDYIGMAKTYRKHLINSGIISKKETENLFLADFICGVPVEKNVFGLPIKTIESLTSFAEIQRCTEELLNYNLRNVSIKAEGCFNNGLEQQYLNKIKIPKKVGNKSDLKKLSNYLEENNIEFYPQAYLTTFFSGGGFNSRKMNIRGIDKDISVNYEYDYLSRYRRFNNRFIYQLSPMLLKKEIQTLLKDDIYNLNINLALSDVSEVLCSDFSDKQYSNREESLDNITDILETISKTKKLLVSNPNEFALSTASVVSDLPLEDSCFKCCDESIPFYQTVLRGYVNYTSKPLNYEDDYTYSYLKSVEYGSGMQFVFSNHPSSTLKNSDYNYINKNILPKGFKNVVSDFNKADEALKLVDGCEISSHKKISQNLYRTVYENGVSIIVNYNNTDITVGNITVKAADFALERLGE